ncbi:hypothetical protein EV363DRAFT_1569848 [Boletus edulis]|uniref:Uncharacterized protein n=1 Tax=Boletus edulis BED1 TaxID=1328754 RepID=A0AAD4B9M3_BOLED|nr:hypothetical protein EV363DRAFT_1569848 [Boletus edulis]KAF8414379.1 hypothetical protein L210DRAFT_988796 [Boletus edulis BED1]
MSAFKLLLLLSSSISFHLGLGRTSSPSPKDKIIMVNERTRRQVGLPAELLLKVNCSSHAVRDISTHLFTRATTWLATAAESIVILNSLRYLPDNTLAPLDTLGPPEASQLTVLFILGASLIIVGGILRFATFQTLGPYYTSIQSARTTNSSRPARMPSSVTQAMQACCTVSQAGAMCTAVQGRGCACRAS